MHRFHELRGYFKQTEDEQYRERQGAWAEHYARKLFPNGVVVEQLNDNTAASTLTWKHIYAKTPVIFQPTFVYDDFLMRCDILEYDQEHDAWNLYEVKCTKFPDEEKEGKASFEKKLHIEDIAFQYIVLRACGLHVQNTYLMCMGRNGVSVNPVDVSSLFAIPCVTDRVIARAYNVWCRMSQAKDILCNTSEDEAFCTCLYRGRSSHCKTFAYSHPHVPAYSVHDLHRVGQTKPKLKELIGAGVLRLDDVPESSSIMQDDKQMARKQQAQIRTYKEQTLYIDTKSISKELEKLQYPLYFLDYEAYNSAIPILSGYAPYEYVTFQLSLHILRSPYETLEHHEYLHERYSDPSWPLAKKLCDLIGSTGTVIVWHKDFESRRHEELARCMLRFCMTSIIAYTI